MTTNRLRFVEEDGRDIKTQKKELRAYMKQRRADNENRDVKERLLIENFLAAIAEKERANVRLTVFCYLSYSSEAPTDRLIEVLTERGHSVYAPRMEGSEMTAVPLGEDFTLSERWIREPVGTPYTGRIDICVTPVLAVDERGNRLGYGGGCYDRFFKTHTESERIAFAFDFQIAKNVPTEPPRRACAYDRDGQAYYSLDLVT